MMATRITCCSARRWPTVDIKAPSTILRHALLQASLPLKHLPIHGSTIDRKPAHGCSPARITAVLIARTLASSTFSTLRS